MTTEANEPRRLSRRRVLQTGAALGAAGAAGAIWTPGGRLAARAAAQDAQPKSGGTLVWGMGGDADALDPHTTNAWAAWRQATMMYESLVQKDLTVDHGIPGIRPMLAEKWEQSADGLTWTFHLRQGVKFHDGTDFDADAVRINYERCNDPKSPFYYDQAWHGTYAFKYIKEVKVIDPHTISFTDTQPVAEFLGLIGDYYFFGIISPTQLKKVGNTGIVKAPVGTGPFKYVERVEGDHTTFERFDGYWGQKAYLDKVIVRPILEDQARVIALQTGEIDLMSDPPPDTIQSLVDAGFVLSMGEAPHVAYYYVHQKNEYGSNPKVRLALSYAIDRETIAKSLFLDTATAAYGILSPGMPAWDPTFKPHPYDKTKAKQLLAEAGYPNGFKTKMAATPTASGWPLAGTVAQYIQRNLKDVGIDVDLQLTEWVTYLGLDFMHRTDTLLYGTAWGMPMNYFLNIIAQAEFRDETSNIDLFMDYYNTLQHPVPELQQYLVQGAKETDPEKANDLYRKANAKIAEDVGYLAITHDKLPHLMKSSVKGFIHAVNVNYDLSRVWLEQ